MTLRLITIKIDAEEPSPPGWKSKYAGHHWLEHLDTDGHSFGIVVLQWNPGAKRWSHSGNVGTGTYVDTGNWRYVAECPLPDIECLASEVKEPDHGPR